MHTDMQSPAPRANAGNRARNAPDNGIHSTTSPESQEDFAAAYIARRYRLTPCLARVVAGLAVIGGRFG